MRIRPTKAFLRLWSLANVEAWFCQAAAIEPAHFWVACLKLTDPKIAAAMLDQGASPEDCAKQAAEAGRILAYLEMDANTAAQRRRETRERLLRGRSPREFPEGEMPRLHRSESSRRLFEIALRKAAELKSEELTPMHLLESLFDMQLVSLSSL